MEVGHDGGNLQSITGQRPGSARNLSAQVHSEQTLLGESRSQRLTRLPL
jgi:hypothetical protein